MPYYAWRSVNEAGKIERGVNFAQSLDELDTVLLSQQKALIWSRQKRRMHRSKELKRFLKEDFFNYFAHLVNAGVLVPDALLLCARQAHRADVRHVILSLATRIKAGMSLSAALAVEEGVFSPVELSMIKVGEESGSLAPVTHVLSLYAQNDAAFYKRIQGALLMPLVTFLFFGVIALVFLLVAVPHFASMISTLGVEMPPLTKGLVAVQEFLMGWGSLVVITGAIAVFFLGRFFVQRGVKHAAMQRLLLKMPLYGEIIRLRSVAQMGRALSLLLEHGVQVPTALAIVQGIIAHPLLKKRMTELEELVRAGYAVSDALEMVGEGWLPHEVPSLVRLGEASGRLGPLFDQISQRAQVRLDVMLTRVTTLVQPAAMLFLGALIALLVIALYAPLLEMAKGV